MSDIRESLPVCPKDMASPHPADRRVVEDIHIEAEFVDCFSTDSAQLLDVREWYVEVLHNHIPRGPSP